MMEELFFKFIAQLGFPIFVAVYFMTRIEKSLSLTNKLLAVVATRLNVNLDEIDKEVK